MQNNEKELKDIIRNVVANIVYRSWVALVSSIFSNAITALFSKIFRKE